MDFNIAPHGSNCCLCNKIIKKFKYDLNLSKTSHSSTPVFCLIDEILPNEEKPVKSDLCPDCYLLLDELDSLKVKTKLIQEQLRNLVIKTQIANKIEFSEVIIRENNETNKEISENISTKCLHACFECDKQFKTRTELKNHRQTHSAERPYICEICGKSYKKQQALKIHVDMHNGINQFTCNYCNKSFTQKGALVRHMPQHTGEKPYQCDLCGKRFIHHTSFKTHKISHSGEKSHKCDICGLLLITTSSLQRHKRVHSGEKRHVCSVCGKKFAEKYNLTVHERLHIKTQHAKTKSPEKVLFDIL